MKENNYKRRIKKVLARKALPTVLAGSMLFSGGISNYANAYSLELPNEDYEDYLEYDGIKVFINGRYVEFNDSTGYPFIENGSTMIPLRAVSEAFGALVEWDNETKCASVSKYDISVDVPIDKKEMVVKDLNSNEERVVNILKEATLRDGITYIPLRSLFENFGLNVRWDSEKKQVHIETVSLESLEYIDFKEEKIYTIDELIEMEGIKEYKYDGKIIDKEYLNILRESNQYVVVLESEEVAFIMSYQFLSNLNYFYCKFEDLYLQAVNNPQENGRVHFNSMNKEMVDFFSRLFIFCSFDRKLSYNNIEEGEIKDNTFKTYVYLSDMLGKSLEEAKKIAEEIKVETSDKKEQLELLVDILHSRITYDRDGDSLNFIYSALVKHDSRCQGFAYAFNVIAKELGIICIFSSGSLIDNSVGHAWNEVYLDGEWYIYDATNNVKGVSLDDPRYTKYCFALEGYFEDRELVKLTYKFSI